MRLLRAMFKEVKYKTSKTLRETISQQETGVSLKLIYTSNINTTSTCLVRSSAIDETQQRKRGSNKLILMLSLLRIYVISALIPGEDTKNKCVPFPVFMFMLLRSSLNLYLCLCCEWKSVFTARNISMCPCLLSGSLEQLDYKVNSTGTEDNSILLQ